MPFKEWDPSDSLFQINNHHLDMLLIESYSGRESSSYHTTDSHWLYSDPPVALCLSPSLLWPLPITHIILWPLPITHHYYTHSKQTSQSNAFRFNSINVYSSSSTQQSHIVQFTSHLRYWRRRSVIRTRIVHNQLHILLHVIYRFVHIVFDLVLHISHLLLPYPDVRQTHRIWNLFKIVFHLALLEIPNRQSLRSHPNSVPHRLKRIVAIVTVPRLVQERIQDVL